MNSDDCVTVYIILEVAFPYCISPSSKSFVHTEALLSTLSRQWIVAVKLKGHPREINELVQSPHTYMHMCYCLPCCQPPSPASQCCIHVFTLRSLNLVPDFSRVMLKNMDTRLRSLGRKLATYVHYNMYIQIGLHTWHLL